MPSTTPLLALPYPSGGDGPDGPGAVSALALKLDGILGTQGWAPSLNQGPVIGANGGADGSFMRIGKHLTAKGRIVFGSSAGWGSPGSGSIASLPLTSNIDQRFSSGYGRFVNASNGSIQDVRFIPHPNGTEMWISPVIGGASGAVPTYGNAFQLGAIPQSSTLIMCMDIVMV